jgi:hypothetical protein
MPRNTKTTTKEATTTTKITRSKSGKDKSEPKPSTRIGKSQASKMLGQVPEANVFWCHDGQVLRDMKELRDALDTMSDETFNYHSNEFKKDFSTWVREIVGDEKLAKEMEAAKTREMALEAVESRCDLLMKKAGVV